MDSSKIDGWLHGWMDGWMDGPWMDGWMDGWLAGWLGGWMDGWMMDRDRYIYMCVYTYIHVYIYIHIYIYLDTPMYTRYLCWGLIKRKETVRTRSKVFEPQTLLRIQNKSNTYPGPGHKGAPMSARCCTSRPPQFARLS